METSVSRKTFISGHCPFTRNNDDHHQQAGYVESDENFAHENCQKNTHTKTSVLSQNLPVWHFEFFSLATFLTTFYSPLKCPALAS